MQTAGPRIIMGDFTANVEEREKNVVRPLGLCIRYIRRQKLIEWRHTNNLIVGNSWFQQLQRKKWTWKSPGNGSRNQIDHILIRKRFRNGLLSVKTYPGADCYTDHVPVAAKHKLKLKKPEVKLKTSNVTWIY